jgi:hypothetical protein
LLGDNDQPLLDSRGSVPDEPPEIVS